MGTPSPVRADTPAGVSFRASPKRDTGGYQHAARDHPQRTAAQRQGQPAGAGICQEAPACLPPRRHPGREGPHQGMGLLSGGQRPLRRGADHRGQRLHGAGLHLASALRREVGKNEEPHARVPHGAHRPAGDLRRRRHRDHRQRLRHRLPPRGGFPGADVPHGGFSGRAAHRGTPGPDGGAGGVHGHRHALRQAGALLLQPEDQLHAGVRRG